MTGSQGTCGALLLTDISGYTRFLQDVASAHGEQMATMPEVPPAYPLITSLLDGIVEQIVPPFQLSKFEGDAVFAFAPDDAFEYRGDEIVECMKQCYAAYRARRDEAVELMFCDCAACGRLRELELKFVLHWGSYVVQSIAGHNELMGPDVTMAHLLLKNNVSKLIGCSAYALLTQSATQRLDVRVEGAVPHTEHFDHYLPVEAHVFSL